MVISDISLPLLNSYSLSIFYLNFNTNNVVIWSAINETACTYPNNFGRGDPDYSKHCEKKNQTIIQLRCRLTFRISIKLMIYSSKIKVDVWEQWIDDELIVIL